MLRRGGDALAIRKPIKEELRTERKEKEVEGEEGRESQGGKKGAERDKKKGRGKAVTRIILIEKEGKIYKEEGGQ